MTLATRVPDFDTASHVATLERDGITALKGAFPREWADRMREDMMTAFWAAIQRPGGAVGRGPRRWYVEVHPQDIDGLRRPRHPSVGRRDERGGARPGLPDRGDRVRRPVPGRPQPAVAPGLPEPARHVRGPPNHVACLQPHRRRRHRGHGPVRDRARHPVRRRPRVEARDVPGQGRVAALRRARRAQVPGSAATSPVARRSPIHRGTQHDSPIARPVLVLGVGPRRVPAMPSSTT